MHLLIERCWNVGMGVPLKRGVLGRNRQAQGLSLSLSLRLSLCLHLTLDLDRRHRGLNGRRDIKRLTHKAFRPL